MLLREKKDIIYTYISGAGSVTVREIAAKIIIPLGLRGDMESAAKVALKILTMLVKDKRISMEGDNYHVSDE